jgi:hypothetical protein
MNDNGERMKEYKNTFIDNNGNPWKLINNELIKL